MKLSPDQEQAKTQILDWYNHPADPILTLGGYAGTGKTTVLNEIQQALPDTRIAFVSLTGKAVSVMGSKLRNEPKFLGTMHSFMYFPKIDEKGKVIGWRWREMGDDPANTTTVDLIINDEASMTGQDLYSDLLRYEVPILFVGDHGQLGPVKSQLNLMKNPTIKLEKIHRQAADNPIIRLATMARTDQHFPYDTYGDGVQVLRPTDMPVWLQKEFLSGNPDNFILVARNDLRVRINQRIISEKGKDPNKPFKGARLICLRNDRDTGLFNGEFITVLDDPIRESDEWYMHVQTDNGATHYVNASNAGFNVPKPEFKPYDKGVKFDFGYALTCHKSQGSEAKRVFIYGEGFGTKEEKNRWLYTAITRAQEELYILR